MNSFAQGHIVAAHTFGRVQLDGDMLRLRMLKAEWTEEYATSQGEGFGRPTEGPLVLTAPTTALRQLAANYVDDDNAFPVQVQLVRSPGDPKLGEC